jgi:hypothetical protein
MGRENSAILNAAKNLTYVTEILRCVQNDKKGSCSEPNPLWDAAWRAIPWEPPHPQKQEQRK